MPRDERLGEDSHTRSDQDPPYGRYDRESLRRLEEAQERISEEPSTTTATAGYHLVVMCLATVFALLILKHERFIQDCCYA